MKKVSITKSCINCASLIDVQSNTCKHCQRSQSWHRFIPIWAPIFSVILSIIALIIALLPSAIKAIWPDKPRVDIAVLSTDKKKVKLEVFNLGENRVIVKRQVKCSSYIKSDEKSWINSLESLRSGTAEIPNTVIISPKGGVNIVEVSFEDSRINHFMKARARAKKSSDGELYKIGENSYLVIKNGRAPPRVAFKDADDVVKVYSKSAHNLIFKCNLELITTDNSRVPETNFWVWPSEEKYNAGVSNIAVLEEQLKSLIKNPN